MVFCKDCKYYRFKSKAKAFQFLKHLNICLHPCVQPSAFNPITGKEEKKEVHCEDINHDCNCWFWMPKEKEREKE